MSEKKYWRLVVNYKNAKPGEEDWLEDSWLDCSPEEIIENYNHTLQPGERKRELITAIPLEDKEKPHSWRKANLMTESKAGAYYDRYNCEVCGVTGKRYGLGSLLILDAKYKKRVYCNE